MKIIWMTDLHLVEPGSPFPVGVDPLARLRSCLEDALAHHADADLIVLTGDLIQLRNLGAYVILRHVLAQVPLPARMLLGNHDDREAYFSIFPEAPHAEGFAQFAETLSGFRLIYLDTIAEGGKHHGEFCEHRLAWLERSLVEGGDVPTLLFMHHPPFNIGVPALDALKLTNSQRLRTLIASGNVRQVFCGHLHRCVGGVWAGMPVAVMKSPHVQFALDMAGDKPTRSDEPPGYGVILADDEQVIVHTRDIPSSRENASA